MSRSNRRKNGRTPPGPATSPRQKRAEKWSRIGLILIAAFVAFGLLAGRACA